MKKGSGLYKKATLWLDKFEQNASDKRVLVMLSGGKDSTCCLAVLKSLKIPTTAIYFHHRWCWENARREAHRAADHFGIPLVEFDITKEFFKTVKNFDEGRPCRVCKPKMYVKAMDYAQSNGIAWMCVGDNASDTIVERIADHIGNDRKDLVITDYLDCIEQGIDVYKGIKILRPLIYLKADEVESLLKAKFDYEVVKNYETGDKYFGYWREGCPIQYTDPGLKHSQKTLDQLFQYNLAASKFARQRNIRASVHLPSGNIITIPEGHEVELKKHLASRRLKVPKEKATGGKPHIEHYTIECFDIKSYLLKNKETIAPLAKRFAERIKVKVLKSLAHDFSPHGVTLIQLLSESHMAFHAWPEFKFLLIDLVSCSELRWLEKLEDIIFEVFKTRNVKIRKIRH